MRLINCYHPVMVVNRFTKQLVVAKCGKCPACINSRASNWVQRIDEEMQQHPFNWFVTLTYDELNVNQFIRLREEDWEDSLPAYINSETGEVISLAECYGFTKADINYCLNTKVLLVPDTRDFQLFIKRLRKYISKHYGKTTKIRYYAAFEIGPQTYRPHLHIIFFLDSSLLSQDFDRLLAMHWPYGNTFDPHIITGSCASYVASYLNSVTHLPKIYLHPRIKQKALFSKCPPIGSFAWSKETFSELFHSDAYTITLYRKDVSKFDDVPLWRFVQDRLYPRITAFNRLNHFDRVELYRKGNFETYRSRSYEEIKRELKSPYWRPYFECAFKSEQPYGRYAFNQTSLAKFVSIVCRVCDNAREFGISIDDYVTKIEEFYDKKQTSDLREYYLLQDEYFKEHPVSDILIISANFYISCKNKHYKDLQDWQKYYLEKYMPGRFHDCDIIDFSYSDAFCYRELRKFHDKIFFDNTKRKESNDYLQANRDKFDNIITYNEEIENYVKSETF